MNIKFTLTEKGKLLQEISAGFNGAEVDIDLESYIPVEVGRERFICWSAQQELEKKDFQVEGVGWLLKREVAENPLEGVRGGLLADEMGLGKTIQVIGTMISNPLKHTLIVLPLALMDQWKAQIERLTSIKPLIYHGTGRSKYTAADLLSARVVITTYGLVSVVNEQPSLIHRIHFDRVVFDEAHHLRNFNTNQHKGAKLIKAPIRWLLTGTPIQNRLQDFYSLCAVMGYSAGFYSQESNLRIIVKNSILKRTKTSVNLELKGVNFERIMVEWESDEEMWLAEDIHRAFAFSGSEGDRPSHSLSTGLKKSTFTALLRARQACVCPALMKKVVTWLKDEDLLCDTDYDISLALGGDSKINAVCNKVGERKDNSRAKLVFCHFRGEIDKIAEQLREKKMNVGVFDGRTPLATRKLLLEDRTLDVLVIQIATGSEGLNLQHFKEIYFVSAHWNPAVEDQAVARCHRIGQDDTVDIFRFEMVPFQGRGSTIDAYCRQVQESKRELYKVLDDEEEPVEEEPVKEEPVEEEPRGRGETGEEEEEVNGNG